MILKDKLSKIITTAPDTIQFAKDRKYEESWIIPRSAARPDEKSINGYLSREKFSLIIVEYIWNSDDDDKRFVLTFFLDKNCALQDPKKFVNLCLDHFYRCPDFHDFLDALDSQVVGHSYLLHNTPELANVGIFNHWFSVGPIELWQAGEAYDFQKIIEKIKARPEVEKTSLNFQGLLFLFNINGKENGPVYGIKTPCCVKKGNFWEIDFERVDYWMKVMLNLVV